MAIRRVTFDEADISEGPLASVSRDGVTVRFLSPADVYRPSVGGPSGQHALRNSRQSKSGESGDQVPMELSFDHLQRRVRMTVGLEERDVSVSTVTALLVAYDASGAEVGRDVHGIGQGPSLEAVLEVDRPTDVIARVTLSYSGLGQEIIDDLELESIQEALADTVAPVVRIRTPIHGQDVNSRTVFVEGTVSELNGVSVTINGTPVPARRIDVTTHEFSGDTVLASGSGRIVVRAVDDAGNSGEETVFVDMRLPERFAITDVQFTQTGLLDTGTAISTRRVAGKTALFRAAIEIRTADGRPSRVDAARIRMTSRSGEHFVQSQVQTADGGFGWPGAAQDGARLYTFIPGAALDARHPWSFTLQLLVGGQVVHEGQLADDLQFQAIRGLAMLLVPQHRALDAAYTRNLLIALSAFARMFPVPDGIADLDSDRPGGIRFAVLPPIDYRGRTDPNDGFLGIIPYNQGFLLHDHPVGVADGPDGTPGTADDELQLWVGEYLCTNIRYPEDSDRDGVLSAGDLAHLQPYPGPNNIGARITNWSVFTRSAAESLRQLWNRERASTYTRRAPRAVAVLTRGTTGQNRTGWAGNAGAGETAFWADVDVDNGGFLPHEVGHAVGIRHSSICAIDAGEAVNLSTRRVVIPTAVMCQGLGGGSYNLFLWQREFDRLFDRLFWGEVAG